MDMVLWLCFKLFIQVYMDYMDIILEDHGSLGLFTKNRSCTSLLRLKPAQPVHIMLLGIKFLDDVPWCPMET
jgi:hypothetical protein